MKNIQLFSNRFTSQFFIFFFVLLHKIILPRQIPDALQQQQQAYVDSIFVVHPNQGPNLVLVTPQLNGSNHFPLNCSMHRAFGAKNKLSFIHGSVLILDLMDMNKDVWERCNHLIHSWIIS